MLKSFSLIETLASIILLSIIISNFSNLSTQTTNYINHNTLQSKNNEVNSESISSIKSKIDIDYTIQSDSTIKYIDGTTYDKYTYDSELKLIYFDIPSTNPNLASKTFK